MPGNVTVDRRKVILTALVMVLVGGSVFWWRYRADENERHVTGLIQFAHGATGVDGPAPKLLGYDRDVFATGCSSVEHERDRWIGERGALRVDPDVDWLAGAARAARVFEADGWDVERFWWLDEGTGRDERFVYAYRGEDRLTVVVGANSISLAASSGRCNPTLERTDPGGDFVLVESFDP